MNTERPERKPIRLNGYDYSQDGYYFVTICTKNHEEFFGEIRNGRMRLNHIGTIAAKFWQQIPDHFLFARLDEWVVMPNHVHGILVIEKPFVRRSVGDADLRPLRQKMLLPKIIHGFKSSFTRYVHMIDAESPFAWQRSYHDHIIRNQRSLDHIREYIHWNPMNWDRDRNNPQTNER